MGLYRNGRLYAVHSDHLGTPRLITNEDKRPVWQWPYSAFGANAPTGILKATKNAKQAYTNQPVLLKATKAQLEYNLRYPGQYYDEESQLSYNVQRSYQAAQGRYTQSDPIGLNGGGIGLGMWGAIPSGVDPAGLETVIFYSRGVSGNPFGHMAVATTGGGVYSFGTSHAYGSSATAYLNDHLAERSVEAIILNTTPQQETMIIRSMTGNSRASYRVGSHNCATSVMDSLAGAGVIPLPGEYGFPALPGLNFLNLLGMSEAIYEYLSPGSSISRYGVFNPR